MKHRNPPSCWSRERVSQESGPPQPKRTIEEETSKTAASSRCSLNTWRYARAARTNDETVLGGLQNNRGSSRKHTADTLPVLQIFLQTEEEGKKTEQEDKRFVSK
eukprot:Seg6665.2 transcript_id=Seg6665.2/GoldUCD/mRNA.D3Y31 product="hypothetical protein" protein_id=Seg6665.2/GoldUCD/D3Y31